MTHEYGKYKILELIGEGGFGRVFRAMDPVLKREVAIKTCSMNQSDSRARFLREAEISAALRHPGIVTIYDFGEHEGEPYLVQEFLTGSDLDQIIANTPELPLATKLEYLIQIAEGLDYAHSRGVVHRDIKPSNIRILPDGNVKILDFGIAKFLKGGHNLTKTGFSAGTVGYIAPEQIRAEPISHRADIFSFGALAYELITYRQPFEGDDFSSIVYKIAHVDVRPVTETVPNCPPRVSAVVERSLRKDPEDRFATCGEIATELRSALDSDLTASSEMTDAATVLYEGDSLDLPVPADGAPDPTAAAAAPPSAGDATHDGGSRRRLALTTTAGIALVAIMAVGLFAQFSDDGVSGPVLTVASESPVEEDESTQPSATDEAPEAAAEVATNDAAATGRAGDATVSTATSTPSASQIRESASAVTLNISDESERTVTGDLPIAQLLRAEIDRALAEASVTGVTITGTVMVLPGVAVPEMSMVSARCLVELRVVDSRTRSVITTVSESTAQSAGAMATAVERAVRESGRKAGRSIVAAAATR